ncbi:MAG TPA: FtsW/RodA/SpoVE family cell cycle protein [Actinomycetes bacterium]|nr:FtsW/RodA/SpoVE family cell cycle protein [Actinomycetes bacterium]
MSVATASPVAPTTVSRRHPRKRRGAELALLLFAYGLSLAAFAQVDLVILDGLSASFTSFALTLGATLAAAHVALRFLAPYADPVLLPVVGLLNGLGLTMIHRLELADVAGIDGSEPDYVAQLGWLVLAVIAFILILLVIRDHRILQRYTYTAMLVGLVLLVLPLMPLIGTEINGARIWVRAAGFSFQPAEIAKIVLIVFFAGYLVTKREVLALARSRVLGIDLPRGRDLGPILLAWAASLAVLVFERDLGTSLLFFGVFVALLYIATERRSWLIIGALLFTVGAFIAYQLFDHVQLRVAIWLHPFVHESTSGYQIAQSLYGFATGGILGVGLGQGHPDFVPFAKTDFIMSAFGEELGLTGVMAMLVLYAIIIERGMRTAIAVRDPFGKLLAAGLSIAVGIQVFVVVGGVSKLIPLTGLTTPFLSYGGSSLVANWALIALLLRISDAARRPPGAESRRLESKRRDKVATP